MSAREELRRLFDRHGPELAGRPWASEADRWAELVFCLLLAVTRAPAPALRRAVAELRALELLEPTRLARLDEAGAGEARVVATWVLRQQGCSDEQAAAACRELALVAGHVCRHHQGKPQRLLRRHAERMRDALVAELRPQGPGGDATREAVSLWLQNAASLPISIDHPALSAFCRAHGIDAEELLRLTDELDVNLALLDDALVLAHAPAALDAPGGGEAR